MEAIEIYNNAEKWYQNNLLKLEKINPKNRDLIKRFIENQTALGNKLKRITKLIGQMVKLEALFGKDLDTVTKQDIVRVMANINMQNLSEFTKKDYWRMICQFYKWLLGKNFIDLIDFKIKYNLGKEIKRESIITQDDIDKILSLDNISLRDKAFISLLYETGSRIGEILTMRINSVMKESNFAKVRLRGKTGERNVLIVSSVPHLFKYLSEHPFRDVGDKPLWIQESLYYPNKRDPLAYNGAKELIDRLFEKSGIQKKHNPHFFRHSRATELATHLSDSNLALYFGWIMGSDQIRTYIHCSGRDIDKAMKNYYGISTEVEKPKISSVQCRVCKTINEPNNQFCYQCGTPLSVESAMKIQDVINKQTEETIKYFIEHPEHMAKFEAIKNSL